MARDRKMTVGRFLKRNMLYIILTSILVLLLAAVIAVLILLFRSPEQPADEPAPSQTIQAEPPAEQKPEVQPEQPPVEQPPQQPAQSELPEVFQPPFEGKTKFLANQKLALTYDDSLLTLKESDGLYSLLTLSGEATPRMDLQKLQGSLADLTEEDRQWLAVSMVQKYYYLAPPAEQITLQEMDSTQTVWSVSMEVPAYRDAPAAAVRLQLLQVRDQFWYAILLLPEGSNGAALEQAYDNLVIR